MKNKSQSGKENPLWVRVYMHTSVCVATDFVTSQSLQAKRSANTDVKLTTVKMSPSKAILKTEKHSFAS